jgi:glycyl-radical enzyme activating protein
VEKYLSYFNINWLSENDGPGKRAVLFLQGCNLDCSWCHSPHSKPNASPLLYFDSLCQKCGFCQDSCLNDVHQLSNGIHLVTRTRCRACGSCIEACPRSSAQKQCGALVLPTKTAEVSALFEKMRPHLEMLSDSGGITFSGGEPLLQYESLALFAEKCKSCGFHTALETSAIVPVTYVQAVYPFIDTWLVGMRLVTGQGGKMASLEKATRKTLDCLSKDPTKEIIARIPVIPGYTDTEAYLEKAKKIIRDYEINKIEILPFNPEASHYYHALGIDFDINCNDIDLGERYRRVCNSLN